MFNELGWISISQGIQYNSSVLTYKALHNLTPDNISNMINPVSEMHGGTLRSSVNGASAVPKARSSVFYRSFSYSAPKLWNTLPNTARNASSLNSFRSNLKRELYIFLFLEHCSPWARGSRHAPLRALWELNNNVHWTSLNKTQYVNTR